MRKACAIEPFSIHIDGNGFHLYGVDSPRIGLRRSRHSCEIKRVDVSSTQNARDKCCGEKSYNRMCELHTIHPAETKISFVELPERRRSPRRVCYQLGGP